MVTFTLITKAVIIICIFALPGCATHNCRDLTGEVIKMAHEPDWKVDSLIAWCHGETLNQYYDSASLFHWRRK
jgi:hypothetical protein